jgi:hypothetical protein
MEITSLKAFGLDGKGKTFSLLHSVQTTSEVLPAPYQMGTSGSFPGGKVAGE